VQRLETMFCLQPPAFAQRFREQDVHYKAIVVAAWVATVAGSASAQSVLKSPVPIGVPAQVVAMAGQSKAGAGQFQAPSDIPAIKSPLAIREPLNALAMAGGRMVAVGQRGHVLYSDDGKTWVQADVPLASDLTALHFPTPMQGWAVGHEGSVLHTADGGSTWSRQLDGRAIADLLQKQKEAAAFPGQGGDKPLLDVWFEDDKKGYAIGAFNLILRTEDGGQSWTPWLDRVDNPKGMHLYAIRPAGGSVFIVGEQGLVLKLDREKQRFTSVALPYKGTLFGVVGTPTMTIVFGLRGNAWRTTDGGANWTKVETGVSAALSSGIVRADGSVVLVSQAGQVLLSTDDGASFRRIKVATAAPAFAVADTGKGAVAVAGVGGVRVEALVDSAK
jgi:photosystem II stability/assembly factor-like uncharacterized protein